MVEFFKLRALETTMGKFKAYANEQLQIYSEDPQYREVVKNPKLAEAVRVFANIEYARGSIDLLVEMAGKRTEKSGSEAAKIVKRTSLKEQGFSEEAIQQAEELAQKIYAGWSV